MLVSRAANRCLRRSVGSWLVAGWLMGGCAVQESPPPPQATADVGKRLATLEACVERSQRAVKAAAEAGVSAGALAPANSRIADAQDTVDEVKHLVRQGKTPDATDRVVQGLEECETIDILVAKGRQEALERKARAQLLMEAEGRLPDIITCLDHARAALQSVIGTKANAEDLAAVRSPLESAEAALRQARDFLAQSDPKSAMGRLDTAQRDCKVAQETGEKVTAMFPKTLAAPTKAKRER